MKNINQILKQQIELIKPYASVLKDIKKTSESLCGSLRKKLKNKKIKADVFIGGSLAKGTIIKKKKYDVDVFVRFNKKYEDNQISELLKVIIGKNIKKIHGSRDYYQLKIKKIIFEIIPVIKISKPQEARNITDLSYFHVNYINKKIRKSRKLADEILLAKSFAHAQDCYGAESYIHGFSGYALELLICYYKSFLGFVNAIVKSEINEKIIIDDSKFYKNKNEILRELNESKINSPIILIDPTFKQRNALAGLSKETFDKFKESCRKFLKKPDNSFFDKKDIGEELKRKYKDKLITIIIKTNKQAGDIAGTKSKKFFEFFVSRLNKEFDIKIKDFDYNDKKNIAYFYFVLDKKKDEIIKGPPITAVHHLSKFKTIHKSAFIKNHFAYTKIKHDLTLKRFMKIFLKKDKKIIKEMSMKKIELIR